MQTGIIAQGDIDGIISTALLLSSKKLYSGSRIFFVPYGELHKGIAYMKDCGNVQEILILGLPVLKQPQRLLQKVLEKYSPSPSLTFIDDGTWDTQDQAPEISKLIKESLHPFPGRRGKKTTSELTLEFLRKKRKKLTKAQARLAKLGLIATKKWGALETTKKLLHETILLKRALNFDIQDNLYREQLAYQLSSGMLPSESKEVLRRARKAAEMLEETYNLLIPLWETPHCKIFGIAHDDPHIYPLRAVTHNLALQLEKYVFIFVRSLDRDKILILGRKYHKYNASVGDILRKVVYHYWGEISLENNNEAIAFISLEAEDIGIEKIATATEDLVKMVGQNPILEDSQEAPSASGE